MTQFSAALAQAASRNHELLSTLQQTDYAIPTLKQNLAYIGDLQAQLKTVDQQLKKLHAHTEEERKDHVKYRDSTMKRFAYRLGGSKGKEKFSAKEEKEEREFLEAWQQEREANERRDELAKALAIAENNKASQEKDKAVHDKAQEELDQMYNSIFSGPTPEYPVEDQVEENVRQTKDYMHQAQSQLSLEKQAFVALEGADRMMQRADQDMSSALDHSKYDMWGGGTINDMMKRDRLSSARLNVSNAERAMDQACRTQPLLQPLQNVNIDLGHVVSDVFFDNIFSDMAMHDRIKEADSQLKKATQALHQQMREQDSRVEAALRQVKGTEADLEAARKELQRVRAEAFERLAGSADAPPPY